MQINHTHTYSPFTILNDYELILICSCGHRIVDTFFNTSGSTITGLKYPIPISLNLTIPSTINGTTISAIGDAAFINDPNLTQITIPSSVTKIGWEAFHPSTVLAGYGGSQADKNLVVAYGTKDTYVANGWNGFNIVEMSETGPLTVKSGRLIGEVEIPAKFNNRLITQIGKNGFANQTEMTKVTLPKSVASINSNAFADCSNLEGIFYCNETGLTSTPDHSTSYSNNYFSERLLNVNLSANCTYTLTFDYDNLTASTDVSNVFTSLGAGSNSFATDLSVQKSFSASKGQQTIVFTPTEEQLASGNKLWCRFIQTSTQETVSVDISNVKIESGVTDINVNAFAGCDKLASPGLAYRLLANDTYEVTGIVGNEIIALFLQMTKTIFIPAVYNGKAVTQIAPGAFSNMDSIQWVFMQTGLTSLGNRAFQFCSNLKTVDMYLTSVTSIDAYTFDTCSALNDMRLPESLLTIGEGAFIRTKIILTIPSSVTHIGSYAFAYGERIGFGLPDSIVSIGSYALAYSTGLLVFTYDGSSLTTIGAHAFDGTPIPTVAQIYPSVTSIGDYAFYNSSFYSSFALPADSQLTTIGAYAFGNNNLKRIVIPSSITNIGSGAFSGNDSLTIYTERSGRPSTWNSNWNSSNRPVVWGCTLSSDKTYVVSFTKSASNPTNAGAANGITAPFRKDYNFGGWYTTSDFSGTKYDDIASAPNGTLYAKWESKSCVAEGTLITLADGSQVAVENLTGNESLLVWNMLTGQFDVAPILFIDHDLLSSYEVITLTFSDGTTVRVIDEHAFFDMTIGKYVFLRKDAAQYIGHYFNKQNGDTWTTVQLVNVTVTVETTTAWSPVTYSHLCYYVNGMLSMPGATEGFINIFDVDTTLMKYDAAEMANDIETYGLYTYEEFNEIIPLPETVFNAFNGQYLKVSIGKGLITLPEIAALVERYAVFFN